MRGGRGGRREGGGEEEGGKEGEREKEVGSPTANKSKDGFCEKKEFEEQILATFISPPLSRL